MARIAILNELGELLQKSQTLAKNLGLPLIDSECEDYDFVLVYTKEHLELRQLADNKIHPLYVDFLDQTLQYRQRLASRKNELILRAVGIKVNQTLKVLDATAGLGIDGILLASFGCDVTMLERSPIVAALLRDGLERAQQTERWKNMKVSLHTTDAHNFLQQLALKKRTQLPDVVYLDPMFPERKKSALVKKEMRLLQAIVGKDVDADQLLYDALRCAKKRVVVKRPKLAPHLAGQMPDNIYRGRTGRYDVYFAKNFKQSETKS